MTTRTTKVLVIFKQPFSLNGFDGIQPAGQYSVETDEELLDSASFPAYRRLATVMQIEAGSGTGAIQVAVVDPKELEAALATDVAHSKGHDEFIAWRAANAPSAPGKN
jgi:hypothetical protein